MHHFFKNFMTTELTTPRYIFETSWEVCNKVGGIYTVLSSRAKTLRKELKDRLVFIGPDLQSADANLDFIEDMKSKRIANLYAVASV